MSAYMTSTQYGWHDHFSSGEQITRARKVYGSEPKVNKNGDLEFSSFSKWQRSYEHGGEVDESYKNINLTIKIDQLKRDIKRYDKLGVQPNSCKGKTNFKLVAERCRNKLNELYKAFNE